MRKIVTSSVFILLFAMFSGSAFAGKIEACEAIKHNPDYKGLYGLCNAYWNADENAREKILSRFEKKSGGMVMPGLDLPVEDELPTETEEDPVVCPCWPNGEIDQRLAAEAFYCENPGNYMFASYDFDALLYGVDSMGEASCEFSNLETGVIHFNLSTDERAACAADMMALIVEDFAGECY